MDQPGPPAPAREGNGLRAGGGAGGWARVGSLPGMVHLGVFPGEPGRLCRHRAPGVQAVSILLGSF